TAGADSTGRLPTGSERRSSAKEQHVAVGQPDLPAADDAWGCPGVLRFRRQDRLRVVHIERIAGRPRAGGDPRPWFQLLFPRADLPHGVVERRALENPGLQLALLVSRLEIEKDVWVDPLQAHDLALQRDRFGHVEVERIGVMGGSRDAERDQDHQQGYPQHMSHGSSFPFVNRRRLHTVLRPQYRFVTSPVAKTASHLYIRSCRLATNVEMSTGPAAIFGRRHLAWPSNPCGSSSTGRGAFAGIVSMPSRASALVRVSRRSHEENN